MMDNEVEEECGVVELQHLLSLPEGGKENFGVASSQPNQPTINLATWIWMHGLFFIFFILFPLLLLLQHGCYPCCFLLLCHFYLLLWCCQGCFWWPCSIDVVNLVATALLRLVLAVALALSILLAVALPGCTLKLW